MMSMRVVILSFLSVSLVQAQNAAWSLSSGLATEIYRQPNKTELSLSPHSLTSSAWSTPGDTMQHNMYGDLMEDNPAYIQKSPWWICAIRVVGNNVVTWAFDRYVFNADFARIGFNSWKHNLTTGFEWDTDRFGMNYFFHPYLNFD